MDTLKQRWEAPEITVCEIEDTAGGDPSFLAESDDGYLTAS